MQTQIVNFSIPQPLLKVTDLQAKKEARTRSGLIQEALRVYLFQKAAWKNVFEYGRRQTKKLNAKACQVEKLIDNYRAGH